MVPAAEAAQCLGESRPSSRSPQPLLWLPPPPQVFALMVPAAEAAQCLGESRPSSRSPPPSPASPPSPLPMPWKRHSKQCHQYHCPLKFLAILQHSFSLPKLLAILQLFQLHRQFLL